MMQRGAQGEIGVGEHAELLAGQQLGVAGTVIGAVASLAAMDMADKKPDDARRRFEAVLSKDPKNAQALLAIAELRARSGGAKDEVAQAAWARRTSRIPKE